MDTAIFTGVIPALMTPCRADRTPDFDALVRKAGELISAGMSAVVYCGSMGDWPLLTDAQRREGVESLVQAGQAFPAPSQSFLSDCSPRHALTITTWATPIRKK